MQLQKCRGLEEEGRQLPKELGVPAATPPPAGRRRREESCVDLAVAQVHRVLPRTRRRNVGWQPYYGGGDQIPPKEEECERQIHPRLGKAAIIDYCIALQ